ncbi:MAG: esterase-like activity of phytase family protein [Pseudomonadota bacterium]
MHNLIAAALILWAGATAAQITHLQTVQIDRAHEKMRGASGLELSPDGRTFTVVTDFSDILFGDIVRTKGSITGVTIRHWDGLKARSGRTLVGPEVDAEGLAIDADGKTYVSFERIQRVAHFPDPTGPAINLGSLSEIAPISGNSGIEALAIHPNGRLFAIPEVPEDGKFPILQFKNDTWHTISHLMASDKFKVVGADFDTTGQLYVLERRFNGLNFTSRIRRGDVMTGQFTQIWRSRAGQFDNLEGLSFWVDETGTRRLTLISDDNDNWFQQTQLVEFSLQDD